MAKKTTARKKQSTARTTASKSAATPKASPPASPSTASPTAEELAAQGLALLRQALLGQHPADQPHPDPTFGIQALERSLAVLVGERHAARLQRLDVAARILEERVFSKKVLDRMSRDDIVKLYRLTVSELSKGPKGIKDLLSRADAPQRTGSSIFRPRR